MGTIYIFTHINDNNFEKNKPDAWLTNFIKPPRDIEPQSVFTFLCEITIQKPDTLTNTCADFGESVIKIHWETWGIEGAKGTGIYAINDCLPSCAEGRIHKTPVDLQLEGVTTNGRKYFLNNLTIFELNKADKIVGTWDLSSFYREVPEMRSD